MFGIVLSEYLASGLVLKIPTLIVSVLFIFVGILLFVGGLILDIIDKKSKQFYELELNRIAQERKMARSKKNEE